MADQGIYSIQRNRPRDKYRVNNNVNTAGIRRHDTISGNNISQQARQTENIQTNKGCLPISEREAG